MSLLIIKKVSLEDLRSILKSKLPTAKVKSPLLNKNVILVQKGASMVRVKNKNGGVIEIKGELNIQNIWVALGIGIGVVAGFIGGLIFFGIAWLANKGNIEAFEKEVFITLKEGISEKKL